MNYQAGAFVFGFEGDFAGMTLKGHATGVFSGTTPSVKIATSSGTTPTTVSATVTYAGTSVYETTADWATTLTGRVGYTFDRVQAYGKAGMAVEQDGDTEVSTTTTCSTNPSTSTTPAGTISCSAAIARPVRPPDTAGPLAPAWNMPSTSIGQGSSNTITSGFCRTS